ncbi:MAG: cell division protein ZapA, partial [Rickettsiales bacterium]|nr:cell division protein ZapA [Rickettsiales bacterium]
MAQVNFIINSKTYPVSCKEGQEDRLRHLQAIISKKENEILTAFKGNISHEMLMMMIALVLSDELSSKTSSETKDDSPSANPKELESIEQK